MPNEATSLVMIFDDPDAAREPAGIGRTFDHWILYNIPPTTSVIPEDTVPPGAKLATNDFGRGAYGGPCPPTFEHEYHFRLLALDSELDLATDPDKATVLDACEGHVLAEATLLAHYDQPRDQ